jgi:hypothetical protein
MTPHTHLRAGTLADCLEEVATGLAGALPSLRLAFSHRLLALFSEFGLANDLDTSAYDLVALLPAVSAACDLVNMPTPPSTNNPATSRYCASGMRETPLSWQPAVETDTAASAVLAALEGLCAHDGTCVKLFRNVWLYCGMLGLHAAIPPWLHGWPRTGRCINAMGCLAAATPVLLYGTGVAKEREAEQRVQLELQPHLSAGGHRGTPSAIVKRLRAIMLSPPSVPKHNPSNAFLLAIATLEMSRVQIGPLPSAAAAASPLTHSLAYAAGARAHSVDALIYVSLIHTAFDALTTRLCSSTCADRLPFRHLERLADALIQSTCWSTQEPGRGTIDAEAMLNKLLERAPSLYYSAACIKSWVSHDARDSGDLVSGRLSVWLESAAARAPTHMEHTVQSLAMASTHDGGPLCLIATRPTRLLDAVAKGREQSKLEEVSTSNLTAIHDKSTAIGRVTAMLELLPDAEQRIHASVATQPLAPAAASGHQRRCLDAAALVVTKLRAGELPLLMIEALCELPLQQFTGDAMRNVVFAWHWVVAESATARDAIVAHMLPTWEATLLRSLGLFSGTWVPPVAPLSSGDLRTWDAHSRDAAMLDALRAHHVWVLCLLEIWESSRHAAITAEASPLMASFLGLFRCAVVGKGAVSTHPLARAPLFRLLTLAVRFCRHLEKYPAGDGTDHGTAASLFGGVLSLGLRNFEQPISVMMPGGARLPAETMNALTAFLSAVDDLQARFGRVACCALSI